MRTEADLRKLVTGLLRDAGAYVVKMHGSRFSSVGTLDLHVDHPTWTGWVELKAARGELTPAQLLTARRARHAGARAVMCRITGPRSLLIRTVGGISDAEGIEFRIVELTGDSSRIVRALRLVCDQDEELRRARLASTPAPPDRSAL